MRKIHTKSRHGCKQCKERKVKCDETKPACRKCTVGDRQCSYLEALPSLPLLTPTPSIHAVASSPSLVENPPGFSTPDAPVTPSIANNDGVLVVERYSLLHLQLFDHLRSQTLGFNPQDQPILGRFIDLAIVEGAREPYLMDELLAFTAVHKSTLVAGEEQRLYRTESTKLQSRALAQIDLSLQNSVGDHSVALFLFSVIVGQHVLFDVHSSTAFDFAQSLDKLIQCFDLHQGIKVAASQGWEKINGALHGCDDASDAAYAIDLPTLPRGQGDCDSLLDNLQRSELDARTLEVYCETVNILQHLLKTIRTSPSRRIVILQEWPVRISSSYITLLRQRRPEALVILAYYAVLLHQARDYWAVGDLGKCFIMAISGHLGDYWTDWLTWPQSVIRENETV